MPNFRGGNYRSAGNFSVKNECKPTISVVQNKLLEVRNVLGLINDTNIPIFMKLKASEVRSEVQKYP